MMGRGGWETHGGRRGWWDERFRVNLLGRWTLVGSLDIAILMPDLEAGRQLPFG